MSPIPAPLEKLLRQLGKLPGLGPRSAQRAALALLQNPEKLHHLQQSLHDVQSTLTLCSQCGNLAFAAQNITSPRCEICSNPARNPQQICVVEGIADVWAIERSRSFQGHYHILGGTVSALTGTGPEDLKIPQLTRRTGAQNATEIILALGASIEGQTTSHIITDRLQNLPNPPKITTLAKGMPVGAAVDYMDEGTLTLALQNRQALT